MNDGKKAWLICYDIASPSRLAKVHRLVRQEAIALQRSVYFAELTAKELETLVEDLQALICEAEDDVRLVPQQAGQALLWQGLPLLPEGMVFGGAPSIESWLA